MKSKNIGIALLIVGILYLLIVSWLCSWWYVSDYRELGSNFISSSSWFTSLPFNIIWGFSAPLGSVLVILGFALSSQVEKKRILFFSIGSAILLFWLAIWYVSSITSRLYGIGGGIIIICFIISVWSWAKKRPTIEVGHRLAADLRIISYLFFLIAAWGLCGLLGSPLFALRPEIMIEFKTQQGAYSMGAKIIICLVLGFILAAISEYTEIHSKKEFQ